MKKWKFQIKLDGPACTYVIVTADTSSSAVQLAEMQYGKQNILGFFGEVR